MKFYIIIVIHLQTIMLFPDVWIGYSDIEAEGQWQWLDVGENWCPSSWTNWNSVEPSNSGGNEDCATIMAHVGDGEWSDQNCGSGFPALCEHDPWS